MERAKRLHAIVDGKGRSSFAELHDLITVDVVNIRDVARRAFSADDAILIDADLRDMRHADLLLAHLPQRARDATRIVVVEQGSPASVMQASALGASDLLTRPLDITDLRRRLVLRLAERASAPPLAAAAKFRSAAGAPGGASIDAAAAILDRMFGALHRGGAIDMAAASEAGDEVIDAIDEMGLSKWLSTVRQYHEGTFQHCLIVTGVATSFGHRTGMRRADVQTLTMAGLLHDVGKAHIPVDILDKPGKLTPDEFATIRTHATVGYDYLRAQGSTPTPVLSAVRHHHEYLDGSGYPDGLGAAQIGDVTRILTVCDVYGALIEERAYKKAKTHEDAIEILMGLARDGKVEGGLVKALAAA